MPSSFAAFSNSLVRIWPSTSGPGCCSSGPNQPLSPRVAHIRCVSTPWAEYFASVPPIPIDSSSGCANTANSFRSVVTSHLLYTLEFHYELFCDDRVIDNDEVLVISDFGVLGKIVGAKRYDLFIHNENFMVHLSGVAIDSNIDLRLLERIKLGAL